MTSTIEQMTDRDLLDIFAARGLGDRITQADIDACEGGLIRRLSDRAALAEAGLRLANAADVYGVANLDSDDMPPESEELQAATLAMRALLTKGEQAG